jgi:4-azaleucine resistance transporter AzlC
LKDALVVAIGVGFIGISFGAGARAAGVPAELVLATSILVFAGGSQFAALGAAAAGAGPLTAALGGLALNVRYLPLGLSLGRELRGSPARRALAAHFLIDESAALALARRDHGAEPAYWISGLALFVAWNLGSAVGLWLGSAVGDVRAFGLDAAMPASMLALLAPLARGGRGRVSAIAGAVLALAVAALIAPGLAMIGGAAGALVALAWRTREVRP